MTSLSKKELDKVNFADLSNYDEETLTYHIPKINVIKFQVNHSYIVSIKDSIYSNDVLKSNYNKGEFPPCKCLLVDVLGIFNKVLKVNSIEYNLELDKPLTKIWSGYLTIRDIEIVKEV